MILDKSDMYTCFNIVKYGFEYTYILVSIQRDLCIHLVLSGLATSQGFNKHRNYFANLPFSGESILK